ncbi:MAG: UDP-3-O-[3-hydroxymyristoyl] N-acetylglucosamine deacetylase [Bacteroidales bacterium]|nr:UDP-3-O-[3-hydroxymyristoyl] N-acetylglucosamine deacetylase [Bacteroidales bacterium]
MNQNTLQKEYTFEGIGLHTGKYAHLTLCPAPENTGIRFLRTDLGDGAQIDALAENVSNTARSTTISAGAAKAVTVEHLLSALTGLGVDNALVKLDNDEVPILDGSARRYVEAILADGLRPQAAERRFLELDREIEVRDEQSGAWIRITPADKPSFALTTDFNSRVLGIQKTRWEPGDDYAAQIAPCRTFVFFHDLLPLARLGLIRGGDVDNAIVVAEHPVSDADMEEVCRLLGKPLMKVSREGYLNNLELHFPDECGRHKLLDLIGDLRLAGGWVNAAVSAYKSGHTINTNAAKALRAALKPTK